MRIGLAFTLILPKQAVHTCFGSENSSPDRFVPHFQRRINIRTEKGNYQTRVEKCEHRAYQDRGGGGGGGGHFHINLYGTCRFSGYDFSV